MERYMYQDDSFERMLKQKADEYRMYPSDDSWITIQQKIRSNKNTFNWKGAAFLTTVFVSLSLYVSLHQDKLAVATGIQPRNILENKNQIAAVSNSKVPVLNKTIRKNSLAPTLLTKRVTNPVLTTLQITQETKPIVISEPVAANKLTQETITEDRITTIELKKVDQSYRLSSLKPVITDIATPQSEAVSLTEEKLTPAFIEENKTDADLNYEVAVPVTIKSKPVTQIQFYITPSASYRVLISDNKFTFGNLQQNAESAVSHHSSVGLEVGAAIMFPISNRLKFRTGLQLNRNQYIVTASKFALELATVTLNSATTTQRATNLRTSNGYFPENIANTTFQVSIPLGLEFKLAGTQKLSWYIGAAVQPTYQLSATGYLVTGDLKNYIKAPEFLSKLNLNSALESFFRWGNQKFELQAGPQLRYQLFSNSKGKYPVQEHLVDYGFKIGFIKNLR